MSTITERRLRIAGLEILLRSNRGDVLNGLVERFDGYQSLDDYPNLAFEYSVDDSLTGLNWPFPPCHFETGNDGLYHFSREDLRGTVEVPIGRDAPVLGRFEGNGEQKTMAIALRIALAFSLLRVGGMLFHASAVHGAKGTLLFAGSSGKGKTTILRLLAHTTAKRFADELIAVRPTSGTTRQEWSAFATPFGGKSGWNPDAAAPLARLYFLRQGSQHLAVALPPTAAIGQLASVAAAYLPGSEAAAAMLDTADAFVRAVPCYRLEFTNDPGIAAVLGLT
ncbi:MAG: hypothetical protein V2A73_02575 [Pseudomonadota bacterium]